MKQESYLFIPPNLREPLRVDKMCGFLVLREFVGGRFHRLPETRDCRGSAPGLAIVGLLGEYEQ